MTFSIIVILLIVFFVYKALRDRYDNEGYVILSIGFLVVLVIQLLVWYISYQDSVIFVKQRDVIQQTLNEARLHDYETVSITSEVMSYNYRLTSMQHDNELFLWDKLISDNIASVEPIK